MEKNGSYTEGNGSIDAYVLNEGALMIDCNFQKLQKACTYGM